MTVTKRFYSMQFAKRANGVEPFVVNEKFTRSETLC